MALTLNQQRGINSIMNCIQRYIQQDASNQSLFTKIGELLNYNAEKYHSFEESNAYFDWSKKSITRLSSLFLVNVMSCLAAEYFHQTLYEIAKGKDEGIILGFRIIAMLGFYLLNLFVLLGLYLAINMLADNVMPSLSLAEVTRANINGILSDPEDEKLNRIISLLTQEKNRLDNCIKAHYKDNAVGALGVSAGFLTAGTILASNYAGHGFFSTSAGVAKHIISFAAPTIGEILARRYRSADEFQDQVKKLKTEFFIVPAAS